MPTTQLVSSPLCSRATSRSTCSIASSAFCGVKVQFVIQPSALELIDEFGEPRLYPGRHSFIASRGHGLESIFNTTLVA